MKNKSMMQAYKNNVIVQKTTTSTSGLVVDTSSENKGEVVSIGEDVKTLKQGDIVYWKGDHHIKLGDKIIMEDIYIIAYED